MVYVPRRWTVILRDLADAARPIRSEDCHGLLNHWWPQPQEDHTAAKRWSMNGWPAPLGDRLYHWSVSWLDDDPPPVDPETLVGQPQRIGDHLMEPLSVTRTFDRTYAGMLAAARGPFAVRSAVVRSRTPVVMVARDSGGERIPQVWPSPRRLFGAVHRSGGGIVGGSGAVGAVARFAPADLADPWLDLLFGGLAHVRRVPLPEEPVRVGEHRHNDERTVLGWEGGLRLELVGGERHHADAFAALLELVELSGVGKYTAQGFGAVRVDTMTGAAARVRVPTSRGGGRRARVRTGDFSGTLFD
ncbi:CRISPR system precrRNA processing endoribonuclease RAMP protein Cas6 [Nocardiopsis sp. CNT312]|uniref:CRISPR system precrRNA processing endoribonuclease RAMP protein Cas6 n=1 Tax=Nocardiopsis sp. CNT312 TaxID=1137268 RepID=UPI0018CC3FFF|nr:CRISPR system precrRNA processing endoribonuclease RAMP protein Cas6 [Nocardiopsis sp. CNT312]